MSIVLYRSLSPYVPQPIERPQQLLKLAAMPQETRRLRILIASSHCDPTIATEGLFVTDFAAALAGLGHHVDVACAPPYPELDAHTGLIELPAAAHSRRSPINVIERLGGTARMTTEAFLFGRRLMRFIENQTSRYDLLLDNQTLCWGFSRLRHMGIAVIGIIHDSEPPTQPVRRRVLKHADRILVLSPHAFEELGGDPEIDHRKLALVPRGNTSKGERAAAVLEEVWADLPDRASLAANAR